MLIKLFFLSDRKIRLFFLKPEFFLETVKIRHFAGRRSSFPFQLRDSMPGMEAEEQVGADRQRGLHSHHERREEARPAKRAQTQPVPKMPNIWRTAKNKSSTRFHPPSTHPPLLLPHSSCVKKKQKL